MHKSLFTMLRKSEDEISPRMSDLIVRAKTWPPGGEWLTLRNVAQ
jgi:hypothetical protein